MPRSLSVALALTVLLSALACDVEYARASRSDTDMWRPGDDDTGDDARDDAPDATSEPEPIVVTTGTLQRFGHLIWAGDRYAIDWIENIAGHLFVVLAFLDPQRGLLGEPIVVSPDYAWNPDAPDASPQSSAIFWDGEAVQVYWADETKIELARHAVDGALVSPIRTAVEGVGPHAYLHGVLPRTGGGTIVVWRDDRDEPYRYLPQLARVLPDRVTTERIALVDNPQTVDVGGVVINPACACIELAWKAYTPPTERTRVMLSRFDEAGQRVMDDRTVFEGDTVHFTFTGEGLVPGVVGVWDYDRGAFLQWSTLDQGPSPTVALPESGGRPALARSEDGAVVAAISPSLGSSALLIHTLDASSGALLSSGEVPGSSDETLDAATITASGDGFGVLMDRRRDVVFVRLP